MSVPYTTAPTEPRSTPTRAAPGAAVERSVVALTRAELVAAVLIVAIGLAVRVWRPELGRVQYDEADAASLVAAWQFDGHFPIAGTIGSTTLANAPAWPYILAVGLLVSFSPYVLLAVGVVTGALTVALCWWVGRRWFGPWAAIAAAGFYAGGFFPVYLGRTAWQLAFVPPLTLLCLDALLMLAVRRRAWALVLACGWLGLMFQFHYVTAIHLLMLPLAMWPARQVLRPVHLVGGLLALVLGTWPFPLYEVHPAVRLADVSGLLASQSSAPRIDLSVLDYLWNLSSNAGAIGLGAPSEAGLRPLLGRWTAAAMIGSFLVAAGSIAAVVWWPRGWRGWMILAWLVLPQIILARHTLDVLLHYVYPDLPVLALATGILAGAVAVRIKRLQILRLLVPAGVTVYAASCLGTLFIALQYTDSADTHLGYGIPLAHNMEAGQVARAYAAAGTQVLIGAQHYQGEILRFTLGFDRSSRTFDDCQAIPYDPGAIYLLMSEQTPGAAVLEASGAHLLARVVRPGDAYRVYSAPTAAPSLADPTARPEYASTECQERRAADQILPPVTGP